MTTSQDTTGSSRSHTKEATGGKKKKRLTPEARSKTLPARRGRTFQPLPPAATVGGRGDQSRGSGGWAGRCPLGRGELLRK